MNQETVRKAFQKATAAIAADPKKAKAAFLAVTKLVEGVTCSAKVRHFPPLTVDEPPGLGGQDSGMNPVELVLVALGTCQEIMYAGFAALMGIPLESVKVEVEGDLDLRGLLAIDDGVPAGFSGIRFETTIKSDAEEETLKRLAEAVETHCPVLDTLNRPIEVSGEVTLRRKGQSIRLR